MFLHISRLANGGARRVKPKLGVRQRSLIVIAASSHHSHSMAFSDGGRLAVVVNASALIKDAAHEMGRSVRADALAALLETGHQHLRPEMKIAVGWRTPTQGEVPWQQEWEAAGFEVVIVTRPEGGSWEQEVARVVEARLRVCREMAISSSAPLTVVAVPGELVRVSVVPRAACPLIRCPRCRSMGAATR